MVNLWDYKYFSLMKLVYSKSEGDVDLVNQKSNKL